MYPIAGVNHLTKFGEDRPITVRNDSNFRKMPYFAMLTNLEN